MCKKFHLCSSLSFLVTLVDTEQQQEEKEEEEGEEGKEECRKTAVQCAIIQIFQPHILTLQISLCCQNRIRM